MKLKTKSKRITNARRLLAEIVSVGLDLSLSPEAAVNEIARYIAKNQMKYLLPNDIQTEGILQIWSRDFAEVSSCNSTEDGIVVTSTAYGIVCLKTLIQKA